MGYYVVIDLEMCKVPKRDRKGYGHTREIIQIGAVLLNEEYEVIDKYNSYVKPEYGYLTKHIKDLTGITEIELGDAPCFKMAMDSFEKWLPDDVTAISWSFADKDQFVHELTGKGIPISSKFNRIIDNWIDCQPEFSRKMNMLNKLYSLEEALIATDICTDGRAHNGLDDAYNTALLYAKMMKEETLVLNSYYSVAHNKGEQTSLSYGLEDIIGAAGF